MQEFTRTGGTSKDGRTEPAPRLFATFKLATSHIALLRRREPSGPQKKVVATVNRLGLVAIGRP